MIHRLLGLFVLVSSVFTLWGATVTWTGSGDGTSWNDAHNWRNDQVPGPTDDVVINTAGGSPITVNGGSVAIRSLHCDGAFVLSSGTLTVTGGASYLNGALTMSSGTVLSASGSGTVLTCNGPTSADGASFSVDAGGVLSLPGLASYTKAAYAQPTWQASGTSSKLMLPSLTNLVSFWPWSLPINALAGGQVIMTNLATLDGPVTMLADGTNSSVDLSQLTDVTGVNGSASFTAQNGAAVLLPVLANLDGGSLSANGGSVLSLPRLASCTKAAYAQPMWQANGLGSKLVFPSLTNLVSIWPWTFPVNALAGGQVIMTNLAMLDGSFAALADGSNSVVDFSRLMVASGTNDSASFTAQNGGTLLLPVLTVAENTSLALGANSVLNLPALGGWLCKDFDSPLTGPLKPVMEAVT